MTRGRQATQPPKGWRPKQTLDLATLKFAATVDDSDDPYIVDGSTWGAPRQLTIELLTAIQQLVETEGRWRQRATVQRNVYPIRWFAEWVGRWNDPNVSALTQPQSIGDITPAIWAAWSLALTTERKGRKRALIQVALVLRASDLLTVEGAERVLARKGRVESGKVEHYTDAEFRAIVAATKRVVRTAHARISTNYADALAAADHTGEPTRESVLYEMLTTTVPTSKPKARLVGAFGVHEWFNSGRDRVESGIKIHKQAARRLLYPDMDEGFAAMVLMACLRGLNLSQVQSMRLPDHSIDSAGDVSQVRTDKPRRGARRFSLEVFGDAGDDTDGRWLRRIEEMTAPLQYHLNLIGEPDDRLFLYFLATGVVTGQVPGSPRRSTMQWAQDLPVVDFQRIKRTYETRYSREATQNTEATHLATYLSRDPERIAEHQERAAAGIERAYDRALQEVQLRFVDEAAPEMAHAEDSTFAACTNPDHEPRTGLPCHDGFLGCVTCPNAVATSRHVPLMSFTLEVLDEIRASLPDAQWAARFQTAYTQLRHVLSTAPTDDPARRVTNAHKHLVRNALGMTGAAE